MFLKTGKALSSFPSKEKQTMMNTDKQQFPQPTAFKSVASKQKSLGECYSLKSGYTKAATWARVQNQKGRKMEAFVRVARLGCKMNFRPQFLIILFGIPAAFAEAGVCA